MRIWGGEEVEMSHKISTVLKWQLNDSRAREHFEIWQRTNVWYKASMKGGDWVKTKWASKR